MALPMGPEGQMLGGKPCTVRTLQRMARGDRAGRGTDRCLLMGAELPMAELYSVALLRPAPLDRLKASVGSLLADGFIARRELDRLRISTCGGSSPTGPRGRPGLAGRSDGGGGCETIP